MPIDYPEARKVLSWLGAEYDVCSSSEGWWLLSRRGSARFLIPTNPVSWANASRLVNGRLQRLAFSAALRFKKTIRTKTDVAAPGSNSRIDDWLRDATSAPTVHKAVYLGTPSVFAKDTIQCQSESGKILGYAKIPRTTRATQSIANEVNTLVELGERLPNETFFPKVLKHDQQISLQSTAPESHGNDPEQSVRDILLQLAGLSRQEIPWELSPAAAIIQSAHVALAKQGNSEWADSLKCENESIAKVFRSRPLPHHLSHGDFIPWNLHGRFVFDWEWAGLDLPWQDFLHYSLFPLLTQAKVPTEQSLQSHLKRGIHRMGLNQHDAFPGFDPQWTRVYLAKRFAFYSMSAIDNGDDPRNFRFLHNFHSLLHR
ncbi:hypothetical protein NT6N_18020 [Oceaniferula spumae]|uniref:Aminoglycoside phosphotransferase domain-containing protein n=1 Tax=Oceaniferula spumae TaxID=2979115 RepID=A0AAT9FLD2_9BACT